MDKIKVKSIFAAVSHKSILDTLIKVLDPKSVKFWGTEGTVKYVKVKGYSGESVVSGFDFGGRLKSIDKKVFAGILADPAKQNHLKELNRLGVRPLNAVIVDLYPLGAKTFPESMDIGGQALIRAAIKNYKYVAVAFDKESFQNLTKELKFNRQSTTLNFRNRQAERAAKFIAEKCITESKLFKNYDREKSR